MAIKRFNWLDWSKWLQEVKGEAKPVSLVLLANELPTDDFWLSLKDQATCTSALIFPGPKELKKADLVILVGKFSELMHEETAKLVKELQQTNQASFLVVINENLTNNDATVKCNALTVHLNVSENLLTFKNTKLKEKILSLSEDKLVGLALALPFLRDEVADKLISATSWQNGAIGLLGILPGSDMPFLTANQIKLVLKLAAVYGERLTYSRMLEMFFVTNSGFFFRYLARQLVSLLPIGSFLVKGSVAYAGTEALGRIAKNYFKGLKQQDL